MLVGACVVCIEYTNHCAELFPGNEATLNFYLSNFTDRQSLINAVNKITYVGGNTNTTGGLRLMRTKIFNEANGDRLDIPNVAILITDGIPTREVPELPDEVSLIKSLGITILGVGVTDRVSESAASCDAFFSLSSTVTKYNLV